MSWLLGWLGSSGATALPLSPYAFDSGLARPQRTLVRDAVVELLSGLLVSNGGYLRAVIPYAGVVRGYTDVDGVDMLRAALHGRAPAIAVACNDRQTDPAGMGSKNAKSTLELALYFYANFGGSLTVGRTAIGAAALGDASLDPGLEIMMEHAEELLLGQRVGGSVTENPIGEIYQSTPSIKRIEPTREEELVTDATATLWTQRYTVTLARTINPYRNVTQLLEEIRTVIRNSDDAVEDVDPDPDHPGAQVLDSDTTIP